MALADDLLPVAFDARGIAGSLGFRPYTVVLVIRRNNGQPPGNTIGEEEIAITEAGGQSPKVRWLSDEEIAVGTLEQGTVEIGPITPAFAGGGTDITLFQADYYQPGDTRHIRLTGPKCPDGALYAISKINAERPLRIILQCKPVEPTSLP